MRVPASQVPTVRAIVHAGRDNNANIEVDALAIEPRLLALHSTLKRTRKMAHSVPAGFPSPADDYIEDVLDLNRHLIRKGHEDTTYVLRVQGWSMIGAGIHDGDEVIVDRALEVQEADIVVAVVNGELTIKRLQFRKGLPVLAAENPHFKDREFKEGEELTIWGVVTRCLHKLR